MHLPGLNINRPILLASVYHEITSATNDLSVALKENIQSEKPIKFVCIGTDRSTGDSLGPLVGTFLKEKGFDVLGTLDEPVHAQNLKETIDSLTKDNLIFTIDASLSRPEEVGYIKFKKGPIKPGAGVNKNLPAVGDYQIYANVNISGFMEYMILQNTRLSEVMHYAKIISGAIEMAFTKEV